MNETKKELKRFLKENGFKGYSKMNKNELNKYAEFVKEQLFLNKKGGKIKINKNIVTKIKNEIQNVNNAKELIKEEFRLRKYVKDELEKNPETRYQKMKYMKNYGDIIGKEVGKKKKEIIKK